MNYFCAKDRTMNIALHITEGQGENKHGDKIRMTDGRP